MNLSEMTPATWYSIGAVARKTGLSVHALRAWERRYSVVTPQRSAGGTRLYSNADVMRLRLLRRATDAGHPISRVADLSVEQLRELLRDEEAEAEDAATPRRELKGEAAWLREEILKAVELMDGTRVHSHLMRAVVALPIGRVLEEVVVPVLREVGDRWAAGVLCPANEHLLTVNVRRVLAWLTEAVPLEKGAPVAVVTTPAGHWHELGAQIAGVYAAQAGWRVVFLGANLPAGDIVRSVEMTGALLVLLGVTMVEEELLLQELRALRDSLPPGVRVVVGGRGAEPYVGALRELGVGVLLEFESLPDVLQAERGRLPS
jgi:MerR family transcriptional regulator, light-induced transcriptional regulator